MTELKKITLENCARLLYFRGQITTEQLDDVLARGKAQEKKLYALRQSGGSRRIQSGQADMVTPAELIASFNLELSGKPGKMLTEDLITEAIAAAVGMPYLKIDPLKLDLGVVTSHIPRPFALKNLIVAVAESGGVTTIAVADPFSDATIRELASARQLEVKCVLSSKSDILKILREFYGFRASVMAAEAESSTVVDLGNLEQFFKMKGSQEIETNDKHVITAVDFLLHYAFEQHASDIHIEPKREKSLIRFRIDGVMHNIHVIPKPLHTPIVSRIKLLSRMDLAEKRRPQDGRIKTNFNNKDIELRVSTVPVAFGEKVVIRIFDPDVLLQDLDSMGFYPRETGPVQLLHPPPQRHHPGHRPHRQRQDHHALLQPALALLARGQHHHGRGPDRDGHGGVQPDRRPAGHRRRLRLDPAQHPAPGPGHHHDRRDPRPRDRRECRPGRPDRPPGALHPAHQRFRLGHRPPDRPGGAALPDLGHGARHHRPAAGAQDLPALQAHA